MAKTSVWLNDHCVLKCLEFVANVEKSRYFYREVWLSALLENRDCLATGYSARSSLPGQQ